ncbi:MAG: hypothetical protein QG604_962, partial [Candidatus Dependentiae bacterium]|nr:hypothetical protein [Candidatus Dependentiae bacterium]
SDLKLEASKAEEEAAAEKLRTMRNKNEWEIRSVCHAEDENTDELERVIRKAEEIDLYHDYRTEALRDAMRFERARIINYLLDPNSSVHVQIDGKSLMEIALQSGEPEMVCLAFDYGAEYSPSMEQGKKSTIMNRALMKKDLALARKLAKHGVMPNNNSMAIAVAAGNIEAVDFLIKEGMLSINAINEDGDTPLLACIKKAPLKFFDAICLALKRGANVEIRDRSGFTPLVIAARGGRYDLVWILFRKGNPDINARADGLTALGHAVRGGHVAVAKYLLKRGAIVDDSIRDELARLLPGDDVEVA